MRLVARLLPGVVVITALALSGCGNPNTKMASLERENARLQAEKQKLVLEVAALRNKLNTADTRAQHWEGAYGTTQKQLKAHIEQLAQSQIRRQIVQRALALAQEQLREAANGRPQAAKEAEYALRVARTTAEEPPVRQP
jgi:outer membrane murein-binding lipoprotein Lpp